MPPSRAAGAAPPTCGCFEAVKNLFGTSAHQRRRSVTNYDARRQEFEEAVSFLASVPLFRTRLPRGDLPKVAQLLQRREWEPGQKLIRQGDTGRAFFLIQSGEASVITCADDGLTSPTKGGSIHGVLQRGDYFGGHTLTTEQRNVATIVAKGPAPLVTLSMSRSAFQNSGLRHLMQFPKRPAIYDLQSPEESQQNSVTSKKEQDFICDAMHRNENLRALAEADTDRLRGIAETAERRFVPRGTVIAQAGDLCPEFFIVREGSISATFSNRPSSGGQLSAEAAVSRSKMAERLRRKQDFLKSLSSPKLEGMTGTSRSFNVSSDRLPTRADDHYHSRSFNVAGSVGSDAYSGADCGAGAFKLSRWGSRVSAVANHASPTLMRKRYRQPRQGSLPLPVPMEDPIEEEEEVVRPTGDDVFRVGDSFGELSLLYNTRWWSTFQADVDCVVYVIKRRQFKGCFCRASQQRFSEYCELLEEVHALTPLVSSERWELACTAGGIIEFQPGERVLHQGRVREAKQWYVVFSGSGVMTREHPDETGNLHTVQLGTLPRASHFGERSLLRGSAAPEISVDAGPEGMCCLTFDFEVTRVLLERIFKAGDGFCPSVFCNIEEWCSCKAHGWSPGDASWHEPSSDHKACQAIQLRNLKRICPLGRGSWGSVFLVQNDANKKRYALKVVSKGLVEKHKAERHLSWERELLLMVDSPFVVRLYKTLRDDQHVYFLLEAALGGTLLELLYRRPEVFLEDTPRGSAAAFYSACLISALEHLHERNIVHRDLKPENALLDERGYAKLADMGFARFVLGKTNTLVGTPDYMAPEMIDVPHRHDSSVDWWALGVVHFELLTGQHPWEDAGLCDQMARLMAIRRSQEKGMVEFPFCFPRVAQRFVTGLLQKLPQRLGAVGGAAEVRGHSMFADLGFDFAAFAALRLESPVSQAQVDGLGAFAADSAAAGGATAASLALDGDIDDSLLVSSSGGEGGGWDLKF